jgi:hypothetical protein
MERSVGIWNTEVNWKNEDVKRAARMEDSRVEVET